MALKITPEVYDLLPDNPVEKLLLCFDAQEDIAAFCFVTPQAVHNWKARGNIPKGYIEDLSKYTKIPTWLLCPKHFDKGESDGSTEFVDEGAGQDRPTAG